MVGILDVELGEDRGSGEPILNLGDERKWVAVFHGDIVQFAEVYIQSLLSIFLWYEQDRVSGG